MFHESHKQLFGPGDWRRSLYRRRLWGFFCCCAVALDRQLFSDDRGLNPSLERKIRRILRYCERGMLLVAQRWIFRDPFRRPLVVFILAPGEPYLPPSGWIFIG